MKNIFQKEKWEYEKVQMVLREFNGYNIPLYIITLGTLKQKQFQNIELAVKNELGQYDPFIEMQIPPSLHFYTDLVLDTDYFGKFIAEDLDSEENAKKDIELYFNCNYTSHLSGENEPADLPIMESNYLVVKPDPIVEPIIFVQATNNHPLPAIYSAEDGSPWYIGAYEKVMFIKDNVDKSLEIGDTVKNVSYANK